MSKRHREARRTTRGSPWAIVFHGVLAVFGWLLFAYFWRVVTNVGLSAGARTALIAMAIFLILLLLLTTWWISHNLRIARKNRRRNTPSLVEKLYLFDTCGLRVEMPDQARMKTASVIEIMIDESHKTYRAMAEKPSDESATF